MVHVGKNLVKIFVNLYFSDFEPSCLLFGGLCSKCPFYRNKLFLREEFLKPILTWTNTPQQFFWNYFSLFKSLFSIFIFIWVIGKLRELCAKFWNSMTKIHGEIFCQSWPLLTPFCSGPIVHWFNFFQVRVFNWALKALPLQDAKSDWLHFFNFSSLCIFTCFLKELESIDA